MPFWDRGADGKTVTSLILSNIIHNSIYYEPMSSYVAMSHVPKVDEAKEIYSLVDADDSKGKQFLKDVKEQPKDKDKETKKEYKNDDSHEYEVSDETEMDDKEW